MKRDLDESDLLYVTDRDQWREWLESNRRSRREIWLVYFKKHTGKPRILYNDAVEEALCVGWIDSVVKRLDEDRMAQRFSVRNPKTAYSQANQERLRTLVAQGKVIPEVLNTLGNLLEQPFEVPAGILDAIRANPVTWEHFQTFSPAYVRIRVAFIDAARKRPEEFRKRLGHFLKMTEQNKLFGFGGIEKHF